VTGKMPELKNRKDFSMLSIQTNVNSLVAQQNLRVNSAFQSKTIQQLTSGYRINSSGDDAAGLAVANKFRNSVAELTQGVANGNDGVAQLQIMDGGMNNISQMLDRLKTLAMQSASASFTGKRETLNSEFKTDIAEIDRQAQSIGLNTGGTFAKSLQIYLGAGSGSQASANSVVSVDLSKSTVDSQSLGLSGVQTVNSAAYDLSSASTTSVKAIMTDGTNAAGASITFKFFGAGFSNSAVGQANDGLSISVNTANVGDVDTLVDAINSAIQTKAQGTTGAGGAFKAANIVASVVTDADGNQKLAFSSSVSGFEVQGGDRTSNALLGFFAPAGGPTGAAQGRTLTTAAPGSASLTLDAGTVGASITISGDGITGSVAVTLGSLGATATLADVVNHINSVLSAADVTGVKAQVMNGGVQIGNSNGNTLTVTETASTGSATLGFGAATGANTSYGKLVANGAYELGSDSTVANLGFSGTLGATAVQDITITANDSSGTAHYKTIQLNQAKTSSIDVAIGAINDALQQSNDSTLQQITAVKVNNGGVDGINLVSNLSAFQVSVGSVAKSTSGATLGLVDASGAQGSTSKAVQNGSGGSADISTMAGAQAAVSAITEAVQALGSAQAAIGKGQNQLGYAIGLAQSQITNFSAAEAQIRDADVAMQAANLTKAQVLQQASMAAMAQANSAPQAVLTLLRG
jgi:flagellin-like hook-associated protein FlgL